MPGWQPCEQPCVQCSGVQLEASVHACLSNTNSCLSIAQQSGISRHVCSAQPFRHACDDVQLHACRLYHFTMQLRSSWFDPMRSLSWLRTNVTLTSCMLLSMLLSVLLSVPPEAPLGALLVMLLGVLLGVLLVMLLQLLQRGKWLVHMA